MTIDADADRFFNRELSWLEFNQRVLDEAGDASVPLVERVKFLAITASNLDEFFRVRVGGLTQLVRRRVTKPDPSGLSPAEQLAAIRLRAAQMMADMDACYGELERLLAAEGFARVDPESLEESDRRRLRRVFESEILPVLSPIAIGPELFDEESDDLAAPLLPAEAVTLIVQIQASPLFGGESRYAVLPLTKPVRRFHPAPGGGWVLLEDIVRANLGRFFAGQEIAGVAAFRFTRDADMTVDDEGADLLAEMEEVLDARTRGTAVRLEVDAGTPDELTDVLSRLFETPAEEILRLSAPLDLSALFGLVPDDVLTGHRDEPWPSQPSPRLAAGRDPFAEIAGKDVLLVHPYDSFEAVVRFIEAAAEDEDVLAIKQTLYRTSRDSRIVDALIAAARDGKHVTVVVELKARFDEARNIARARELKEAGATVLYGVRGLKTHAKLCVVVRREAGGVVRYVHIGTGNYNEQTAGLYSDVSLLTADWDVGHDAVAVFNAITGYSEPHTLRKLDWAPISLRDRVIELIESEAERARQGQAAFVRGKVNSLVDPAIIDALYAASAAGVDVDLNIRGICCLRPGVPGLSENIRVVRIIDRFLEHARVAHFHQGGEDVVLISSADWMPRNLDRRIELLAEVTDPDAKAELTRGLKLYMADNVKATEVTPEGGQVRVSAGSAPPLRAQRRLWEAAVRKKQDAGPAVLTRFEAVTPAD